MRADAVEARNPHYHAQLHPDRHGAMEFRCCQKARVDCRKVAKRARSRAAFARGSEIAVEGEAHLSSSGGSRLAPAAISKCGEGTLRLGGPEAIDRGTRVLRWLKAEARRIFTQRNFPLLRKGGRSGRRGFRWATPEAAGAAVLRVGPSRSAGGLIMAPAHVRRSVIAHEVAHIRHMDHSIRLSTAGSMTLYEGDRKAADRWLKMHGTGLAASWTLEHDDIRRIDHAGNARGKCERCAVPLPMESDDARICSYECTFCVAMRGPARWKAAVPNCKGELQTRPTRVQR